MQISVTHEHGIAVLNMKGRLDALGAGVLRHHVAQASGAGGPLVLNFREVEYLSSLGVQSLVQAAQGPGVVLAALQPFVARVLEIARLLGQFRRSDTVEGAVKAALDWRAERESVAYAVFDGRTYAVTRLAGAEPGFLEHWASGEATLEELGFCFGTGGFGSTREQAASSMGPLVAAGAFAGVLGPEGLSDFVVSDRPAETVVFLVNATGFSGKPALLIELQGEDGIPLEGLARAAQQLAGGASPLGLVVHAEPGVLIVALVEQGRPPEGVGFRLQGRPAKLEYPFAVTIDNLIGVEPVDPGRSFSKARIWVYRPRAVRRGEEKRLRIDAPQGEPFREEWERMARRLYRDCARVVLEPLTGGYMAKTYRVSSYDRDGRRLLATVLKISTAELIRREQEAHRLYVERFILNNSTTLLGTEGEGEWAALRYNFLGASPAEGELRWLRTYYLERPVEEVLHVVRRLYTEILKPWYGQPRWEPVRLYAEHTPLRLFPRLIEQAEADFGFSAETETIPCPELGRPLLNPFRYLKYEYPRREQEARLWYRGITHGDLNWRNVLLDDRENLYVIDFSETRPRNIVADFARMETVLKFEATRLENEGDLARLLEWEQGLAAVESLEQLPENRYRGDDPSVAKAHAVIGLLHRYAGTVTLFETDVKPYWLAVLEWTYSVLCYDLAPIRRKYAAYSAGLLCERLLALADPCARM